MTQEVSRSCEICDVERAEHACRLCGRRVCRNHFNVNKGVCSICSATLCEFCGTQLSVGYCVSCGRMGCEDCMIQVSNVAYVCKNCFSKNPAFRTLYGFRRAPATG